MYQLDKSFNVSVKNAWQIELERFEREETEDLKQPYMSWWEAKPLTESEYFEMMAGVCR